MNASGDDCIRFLEAVSALASPVFVVGGFVRDLYLGQVENVPDIDFVVERDAERFAVEAGSVFQGSVRRFPSFLTFKIEHPAAWPCIREFDIATARSETYPCPGALPEVSAASMQEDIQRRDFTVNAIAVRLDHLLDILRNPEGLNCRLRKVAIDPFAGIEDLEQRKVRILHDGSFRDDPTRMFRACRYAARIGGAIERHSEVLLREAAAGGALKTVSWFRLLSELRKAFLEKRAGAVFEMMEDNSLLSSLPFLPASGSHDGCAAFRRLAAVSTGSRSREVLFETMLRLIVFLSDYEKEPSLFRAASLSGAVRETILADVSSVREGVSAACLTDHGLLMKFSMEKEKSPDVENEMRERGMS